MDKIISQFTIPHWNTIWTIAIITLVMTIIALLVGAAVRKADPRKKPSRCVEFTCYFFGGMKSLVVENMGTRFLWFGPYLVFLMVFFLTAVTLGMIGLPVAMLNISVPLALASVVFILSWVFSIKENHVKHFMKFINPLNVIGELAPMVSMSFRIFGNMVAGGIILLLLNMALGGVQDKLIPELEQMNILGNVLIAPLRLYFDVFGGLVQAFIFTLLTVIYIGLNVKSDAEIQAIKDRRIAKRETKANKKNLKLKSA